MSSSIFARTAAFLLLTAFLGACSNPSDTELQKEIIRREADSLKQKLQRTQQKVDSYLKEHSPAVNDSLERKMEL